MCEILLHYTDKVTNADPKYAHNYLSGDVIAICPDGWGWSQAELTNPNWRLIKMPGQLPELWTVLTMPRFDPLTQALVRKRNQYVNLGAKVPGAVRNQIKNNQVLTLTPAQIALVQNWLSDHGVNLGGP